MLQVLQYQKSGEISLENLPVPAIKPGGILVRNCFSVISAGTERTSIETAQASMIGKARSRPDLVKQVLDNLHREGIAATIHKVQNRLDNYKELGYSSSGIVIDSASDKFRIGDRVACAGFAYHAEVISIPQNLAVKIPDQVTFEDAAFTTLGSIALQGLRQADVKIGENVAVIGLGLIGLITVQLLNAAGANVIGFDINSLHFDLASLCGCNICSLLNSDGANTARDFSFNKGIDAVILCASTNSNLPFEFASEISRKKSRIVVVGRIGMNIPYNEAYKKELEYKLSCSYGPGRYDPLYEEGNADYPFEYVRWTENRNMEAVLQLLKEDKISFKKLITHKIPLTRALDAYDLITGKKNEEYLGILLEYPDTNNHVNEISYDKISDSKRNKSKVVAGFIGAGNFAQSYLLPNLTKMNLRLKTVVTSKPVNAMSVSKKFKFESFSTDINSVLNDDEINTIFIATRHNTHGNFVLQSLEKNKKVYVEKPLCICLNELRQIDARYSSMLNNNNSFLMVGYNRRFSEPVKHIRNIFKDAHEPLLMNYRINAGYIPGDSWYQSPEQNGRIIGEVCHFIDTLQFICDALPAKVFAKELHDPYNKYNHDNVSITITFSNGSVGVIIFNANGAKSLPKEYLEVSGAGKSVIMNDFKSVQVYDPRKIHTKKYSGKKGHAEEMAEVVRCINNGEPFLIPPQEIFAVSYTIFHALESIRTGKEKDVERG